jgi:hypothetical protein
MHSGFMDVLEVNLGPGIASDCVFARCGFAAGWTFDQLVNNILNHAIERHPHLNGANVNNVNGNSAYLGTLARDRG